MSVIERWTITVCRVCGERIDGHRHQVFLNNGPGVMHDDSEQVEVVPAATYRGAVSERDFWKRRATDLGAKPDEYDESRAFMDAVQEARHGARGAVRP